MKNPKPGDSVLLYHQNGEHGQALATSAVVQDVHRDGTLDLMARLPGMSKAQHLPGVRPRSGDGLGWDMKEPKPKAT